MKDFMRKFLHNKKDKDWKGYRRIFIIDGIFNMAAVKVFKRKIALFTLRRFYFTVSHKNSSPAFPV
jgi:hypothetical protein